MKIAENQPCDRNRSNLYFADVNLLNARLGDRRFRQGCSSYFLRRLDAQSTKNKCLSWLCPRTQESRFGGDFRFHRHAQRQGCGGDFAKLEAPWGDIGRMSVPAYAEPPWIVSCIALYW